LVIGSPLAAKQSAAHFLFETNISARRVRSLEKRWQFVSRETFGLSRALIAYTVAASHLNILPLSKTVSEQATFGGVHVVVNDYVG
jgi:hypothetical protein